MYGVNAMVHCSREGELTEASTEMEVAFSR
jgi:hypothetical protein